ncbi:hypothetical protein [Sphingomonas bacterium]|uniref:hypothetical protein n=1 Tax=Sphingomonas bacterium TaxID=1895847 RepID=UPI00157518F2|nr:hypothetical protein [Sphingomonas bacterium]
MLRPQSIITFERCYLGAWLIGLVNLALTWNGRLALADANAAATIGAGTVSTIALVGVVVGGIITLTLWWFVARQASVVAKWIVVVFFGLGVLGFLASIGRGTMLPGIGGVLTVVSWVLQAVAVFMLFRPDANAWFAARPANVA